MNQLWGRGVIAAIVVAGCGSCDDGGGANGGGGAPEPPRPPANTAPAAPATRANGEIASWDVAAPMPIARANHCAVAASGFLVVIGGNYKPKGANDFVTIADVHVARIAADGSLGDW